MIPSQTCIDFIKSFERCCLTAYMPTPKDRPTIGWGTTGPDVHLGMTWTQEQADDRLARSLESFGAEVLALLGTAPTAQHQFDALVSLAYNIGTGHDGFAGSTLRRLHIGGNYLAAADQFSRWNRQAGKVLRGLTSRRAGERKMYLGEAT